ncbi:uncharacterized protein LOC120351043 [Nilaparvata lugens]|uniref:uncharacterized protein LOC120351043 n=1 Tax=Nilaparvata lugens TaxID=108931 RepID=UPI00193D956C|nr:uncharacterized protein LOC120351043 [Nilaparvata lugens]
MGDMNAKIGWEEIYKQQAGSHSLHNESNLNGIRLINFAASKGMVISSTSFPRKNIHEETWVSPDMATYNQIDYVMIDGRHRSNVMDVRTFRGANIDSDHYLVGATLRARISKVKNIEEARRKKFNVGALKEDSSQKFKDCVWNNLRVEEGEDLSGMWRSLRDELERIAEDVMGVERQEQTKTWFDYKCQKATNKKNTAYKKMQQSRGTRSTAEQYRAMRRAEKRIHKKKKKEWKKKELEILEAARDRNETRKFYNKVNIGRKGFMPRTTLCRAKDGELLSEPGKVLRRWKEHFEELYHPEIPLERLVREVQLAVEKLNRNKAPGEDGIPAELLKDAGDHLAEQLQKVIHKVWVTERMPEDWTVGLICPIHKKGDQMEYCDRLATLFGQMRHTHQGGSCCTGWKGGEDQEGRDCAGWTVLTRTHK